MANSFASCPQHHSFYDLILRKARGKSGPLFHFDVHDDVRMVHDARVEKDESHPGKIVERRWYERNKHIFPASRWEVVRCWSLPLVCACGPVAVPTSASRVAVDSTIPTLCSRNTPCMEAKSETRKSDLLALHLALFPCAAQTLHTRSPCTWRQTSTQGTDGVEAIAPWLGPSLWTGDDDDA